MIQMDVALVATVVDIFSHDIKKAPQNAGLFLNS
jgi:hypothetical protein